MTDLDAVDALRRRGSGAPESTRLKARLALQAAIREERLGQRSRLARLGRVARLGRLGRLAQRSRPGRRSGLGGPGRGRRVALVGAAAAVTAVVLSTAQLLAPGAGGSTAEAVVTLGRAAAAAATQPALAPRPDQFVYVRVGHLVDGGRKVVETWVSADGSQAGRLTVTGGPGAGTWTTPPARAEDGLAAAPYLDVAALPTDPEALLRRLRADPSVAVDRRVSGVSVEVAVWSLLRGLFEDAPPPQKAALLRAAALVPGITRVPQAQDALGRRGEAVALTDPRVGQIGFVFDPGTHEFLGERITGPKNDETQFIDALEAVAVVDRPGVRPAG